MTKLDSGRLLVVASLLVCLFSFSPVRLAAAEWKSYRLGEVSFEVPAGWKVVRKVREREFSFGSSDQAYTLRVEWWFPDEPILGYDDIVSHKKITVADRQATYVYSRFPASQSLQVVFDKPRADKRQLLILLESATEDFGNGSAMLDDILSRLSYGGKQGYAPNYDNAKQPREQAADAPVPSVEGGSTLVDGGTFVLDMPPGWKRNSAERDELRIMTLVAPDKRALVLVAEAEAAGGRSAEEIIGEFEELYYQDYALPDSIERDDDLNLGGVAGHYVEMLATLYSVEGVRLPFSSGRSWLFKGIDGARGFIVAVVTDGDAPAKRMKEARGVAASFRLKDAAPSGLAGSAEAEAQQQPVASDYDNDEEVLTDADRTVLNSRFGNDCKPIDLANWRHEARFALEKRKEAHLQWVMRCREGSFLVFGAVFDYDPQGQTDDFFHPLYLAMSRANAYEPYAIVDKPDNLIVTVKRTPDGGIDLDFADFTAAPDGTDGLSTPATPSAEARPLFAGQMDQRWTKWAGSGGDYDRFAHEADGLLAIDVPAGNGWGKTGIRTVEPVVQVPGRTDRETTRLDFSLDPARSDNFVVDLVPAGKGGDEEWHAHQIRFGIGREAGARPVLKMWVEREEVAKHELAEVPASLTLQLRPDGEAIVSDASGTPLVDGIFPDAIKPEGYHVYAIAHAPGRDAAAALALKEIRLTTEAFSPADSEPRFLGPKQSQTQVLFDGRLMGRGWKRYSAHGGDFAQHAGLENGALVVDVPAGAKWGKTGIYSEEPLLWFDGKGEGAMAGLTFSFDPARTTGFVVALSSISSLNGNDPSNPKFLLHWRRAGDNGAKVAIFRDYDKVKEIELDSSAAPDNLALLLTRGQIAVAAPDWGLTPFAFPDVQPGAGFRVYAYSHPDKADEPVKMALKRIELERNADEPKAASSSDVAPLPVKTLFSGKPSGAFEPSSVDNADFASFGRFENGTVVVDVPEKQGQWPKCGLVSHAPVLKLDERALSTGYRLTFKFDPKRTSGAQIIFNGDKRDNMWDGRRASVALIRHSEGRYKDQYVLGVESDGYRQWSRAIDAGWMEKSWDGTLEVEMGAHWLTARIPKVSEVRGSDLRLYKGDELYLVVSSHPEKTYAGSRMALAGITGEWLLPETASVLDRWSYVDNDAFDTAGFLADAVNDKDDPARLPEELSDDTLSSFIAAPGIEPVEMPAAPPAAQRGGWLWPLPGFSGFIASAYAAPAADCDKAIDAHIDEQRRIKITLGEQPDLVKSFVDLGKTIVGNKSFGDEEALAERARNHFNTVMGSISDGIAIGEDLAAGKDTEASLRIMQAALNIGVGSEALKDERTFRNMQKTVRDTWFNAMKGLPPERAEKLIIDIAARFNPKARIDPHLIYETALKEGSKFDWGSVTGELAAVGSAPEKQKALSAALWTMTNTALTTFNPNYAMAKAAADTMLETAKAAKAFAVNDRVADMYRIWKDEMADHPGMGDYDFYKARTTRGDRLPLNEIKAMLRGRSDQAVSDELAEKKLFEMFRKWREAEGDAARKGDRLTGLKKRFEKLKCRGHLARAAWPKGRSAAGKAWSDFKAGESWGEGLSDSWRNYWNSCQPDIELLDKYAEMEAQIRGTFQRFMKPGNECNNQSLIDTDVDIFMCNLLEFGEDQYRKSMMQRLKDCKLVKEPSKAEISARTAHVLDRARKLNHDKLTRLLKDLGIGVPVDLMNCLCRRAGYGSSSTSQYYHPNTIGEFNRKYSCNQPGDPCIVSGFGCTRHPLPNWPEPWNSCMAEFRLNQTKDANGKVDPASGQRLDEVIEEKLRERRVAP